MMDERGVSQSVGLALIFGVIIVSVGAVTVFGYDQIQDVRDNEQLRNAERAMLLVDQNVREIQDGRSAVRRGELEVGRAQLGPIPEDESRFRVRITDTSGPATAYEETFNTSGIRYELGDSTIAYEAGAVFRADPQGIAVMKSPPPFVCTPDRAVIPVVTLEGDLNGSIGGGTVAVKIARNSSTVEFPQNRTGIDSTQGRANVSIQVVESQFASGWERYFRDREAWTEDGNEFVCAGPNGNGVESYQVVRTRVTLTITG